MSRLFAYVGNDQDRVKCALYPARELLVADAAAAASFDAWGLGFYQGGVFFLKRSELELCASNIKSDRSF